MGYRVHCKTCETQGYHWEMREEDLPEAERSSAGGAGPRIWAYGVHHDWNDDEEHRVMLYPPGVEVHGIADAREAESRFGRDVMELICACGATKWTGPVSAGLEGPICVCAWGEPPPRIRWVNGYAWIHGKAPGTDMEAELGELPY